MANEQAGYANISYLFLSDIDLNAEGHLLLSKPVTMSHFQGDHSVSDWPTSRFRVTFILILANLSIPSLFTQCHIPAASYAYDAIDIEHILSLHVRVGSGRSLFWTGLRSLFVWVCMLCSDVLSNEEKSITAPLKRSNRPLAASVSKIIFPTRLVTSD